MTRLVGRMRRAAPPRLVLSSAGIEALKWLALVLMTLDHINTFLYNGQFPVLFKMGRVAMPIFGFVLAYNLARPGAIEQGLYRRVMKRLALFGMLASPPFVALVDWLPFNILFTLLLAAAVMYLLEEDGRRRVASAAILFIAGGSLVEFKWVGVMFCLAAWWYCKRPGWLPFLLWIAAAASLYLINHNFWALVALPVIFAAVYLRAGVPRLRHLFYVYYPAHLAVLWGMTRMSWQ